MKRNILLIFGLSICANVVFAQGEIRDSQEAQKEINAIKQDSNYIYASATSMTSAEEASDNAKELLALEIEEWLKGKDREDIDGYIAKSRENVSQITTKRGKLYRAFAYLKKNEILTYGNKEEVMIVELSKENEKKTSLQKDSTSVAAKTAQNNNLPKANVPQDTPEIVYSPTPREKELLNLSSFDKVNSYISQGKKDGKIAQAGKYATMPQNELVYLIIYNKKGEIPACMKVVDTRPVNIATGKEDPISNYKGCGAIWIKYSNE